MKKILFSLVLLFGLSVTGKADPISINTDYGNFILPFQVVHGTQLYSSKLGKGFLGFETVLYSKGSYEVTFGGAPVVGTDVNVPFLAIQRTLSPKVFDTSDNDLRFGVYVGKPSRRVVPGEKAPILIDIKASIPLF